MMVIQAPRRAHEAISPTALEVPTCWSATE